MLGQLEGADVTTDMHMIEEPYIHPLLAGHDGLCTPDAYMRSVPYRHHAFYVFFPQVIVVTR
jgi:hypothetical protein